MSFKELMISSLTDLLENGESLIHPIYGILNQGNKQHYGFFGFTKSHLLIAFVEAGKHITYTTRIPLDIQSVKIEKTAIFRQYVIYINLKDNAPLKITAAPKVLTIDTQKENLPCFLDYLKNKSESVLNTELKDINGEKIRRQYFNVFIYSILFVIPMMFIMITIICLKDSSRNFAEMFKTYILTTPIYLIILLLPVILLSLCNRFWFGKIIGVMNNEGLFIKNHFIMWKNILKITYTPEISSRYKVRYTYATIFVKSQDKANYSIDVLHFPAYALRKIKKYNPDIDIKFSKEGKGIILFFVIMIAIISVIVPLIK